MFRWALSVVYGIVVLQKRKGATIMKKTNTKTNEWKEYCESKLAILVRDHNHYKKVKYTAAVKDYRTAIDNLIYFADRQGVKVGYTVDNKGYLAIA